MPKWTEDQQKVIDTRYANMLVSAAAGSGKTAVLVERIAQRIMDPKNPIDIDRILVVTFTKAAAAEMRERILLAINERLEQDPGNEHLLRQSTLVHNAQITTIDSFCNYVVRNHFHEIGLDPDYRIGDEGEMRLIRQKVMEDMMQQQYTKERDAFFFTFMNAYARGNSDAPVTDMIFKLFDKAQSYPWSDQWLTSVKAAYEVTSEEKLTETAWFLQLVAWIRNDIEEAKEKTEQLLALCYETDGPIFYEKSLRQDLENYEDILAFQERTRFFEAFRELNYNVIGRKPRGYDGDEVLMEQVKAGRDAIKKKIEKAKADYGSYSLSEVAEQMQQLYPYVEELVRLTRCYMEAFSREKRRRNLMGFNDIEHFALEILKDEQTKEITGTARELQSYYQEIMIDEYQDSNYIQEEILSSIAKTDTGEKNMFMVGDVKQSIYSFRQACPEIFMGKYHRFHGGEEGCVAIDLHQNFRSRKEVLDFTNDVFYPLMHEDIGNVEYDDLAALYEGADYYPTGDEGHFIPEILVCDTSSSLSEMAGVEDKITFEAKVIADKINAMRQQQMVTDKATGKLRPMRYGDVVILLRSPGSVADAMVQVLQENGIPAAAESKRGYYDTIEVQTVLNLLRIIDNPRQDIPFAAVLHSPMFSFSSDEIAEIRMKDPKIPLACGMEQFAKEHPEREKVTGFLGFLGKMRSIVPDTPIHELLEILLKETGYLSYVTAMPRGEGRRANLEKLMDQAAAYENTSYKGLFHFINYVGQLQKYEWDEGEAQLVSQQDNAVTIMSIHKSKGLEFPVVFVSCLGKQFNQTDQKGAMVLHGDLGIGLDLVDYEAQIKQVPLYKKVVIRAMHCDSCGEEMRILYVALTRAKEKLVLTGTVKDAKKTMTDWQTNRGKLRFSEREGAQGYLEWILRATASKQERYPATWVSPEDVVITEVAQQIKKKEMRGLGEELVQRADPEAVTHLEKEMCYEYPFASVGQYKNKYSVSEIKHQQMELAFADEMSQKPEFLQEETREYVPSFMEGHQEEKVPKGALRGTAMHRFLECFDFAAYHGRESVREQLDAMLDKGLITKEQGHLLQYEKLCRFLETPLAHRMQRAAKEDELYVERPFVMSVEPKELFLEAEDTNGQETVLVQGIIDVFFVEEGGIVLLDYKTDRVSESEELIRRYKAQLQLYGTALSRTMDLPIKEILIYSFHLEEMIAL